jgi:NAD(P)-dependent dehydrogenase (short-subunit alcohol dehydrogenase family)
VNNAGILRDRFFFNMSVEEWRAVIDVHLNGSFYVSRAAAPHFKAAGGGAFVHMTSTSGLIGNFGQVNYCSAKMGIVGMSKAIALDMERFSVRSNCIAPFAFTRMVDTIPTDTAEGVARQKINQRLEAAKIAPFACALITDEAKHVTGQIFGVRNNEIYLFSQPRPIRTAHAGGGWTVQGCLDIAIPMMTPSFYPLYKSR